MNMSRLCCFACVAHRRSAQWLMKFRGLLCWLIPHMCTLDLLLHGASVSLMPSLSRISLSKPNQSKGSPFGLKCFTWQRLWRRLGLPGTRYPLQRTSKYHWTVPGGARMLPPHDVMHRKGWRGGTRPPPMVPMKALQTLRRSSLECPMGSWFGKGQYWVLPFPNHEPLCPTATWAPTPCDTVHELLTGGISDTVEPLWLMS